MGSKKRGHLARLWRRARYKIWCWRVDRQAKRMFNTPEKRRAVEYLRKQLAAAFEVPVEILTGAKAYPLRGRALDHEAWELYGIKRQPGETDEELNRRCFDIAEAEYANQPDWRQLENE